MSWPTRSSGWPPAASCASAWAATGACAWSASSTSTPPRLASHICSRARCQGPQPVCLRPRAKSASRRRPWHRGFAMNVRERVSLMGMQIDRVTENQAVATIGRSLAAGRGGWVITPNLEHLRQFSKQADLRPFFENADLVLADGMPLVWASRLAGTPLPARVAGSDLIWSLSSEAGRRGSSVFVLGGTREAGWEAARRLKEKCPGLRIAGMIYPPHGFERDDRAMEQIESILVDLEPDIVYVGLGF